MKKIAIQGTKGSFHDIAAHQFFEGEPIELICCKTFEQVFEAIQQDATVMGLVAIENTIAGSLLHNYELLRSSGVVVVGEHKLHIKHSICCLADDDWNSIHEVHSHPVALAQCRKFLDLHSEFKAVVSEDTAGSAEEIALRDKHGWAAICSDYAAQLYGLKVLQEDIHDNKHNYTRFLVLSHSLQAPSMLPNIQIDKASLMKKEALVRYSPFLAFMTSISLRFSHFRLLVASGNICSMSMLCLQTQRDIARV